ncbi:MAG: hypothetical protein JW755_12920 [Candidatus Aminicenantes bacterium]|nr:hypothetical protein [Candidatus Aminicenantes bacterium]
MKSFLRDMLFFNLLIIAGFFFNIIDWFLKEDISPQFYLWSQTGILIVLTVLKFLRLYSFLEMNRRIIDLSLSKSFSNTGSRTGYSRSIFSGTLISMVNRKN